MAAQADGAAEIPRWWERSWLESPAYRECLWIEARAALPVEDAPQGCSAAWTWRRLYIATDDFSRTVKPTGQQCSFHSFPLNMSAAFRDSTITTVQQLVENVEVVDRPLSVDELSRSGKKGMIVVRADNVDAHVEFIPGFWSSSATSQIEVSASLTVDTQAGRMLGTTGQGQGSATGDAGMMCGGGANVVAKAADKAMKQLLGQLGERLSNSPRLRAEAPLPGLGAGTSAPAAPTLTGYTSAPSKQKACGAIPQENGVIKIVPC